MSFKNRMLSSIGLVGMAIAAAFVGAMGGNSSFMADPVQEAVVSRNARGRQHFDTPGMRSHRKWRRARASGAHNFRKMLAK